MPSRVFLAAGFGIESGYEVGTTSTIAPEWVLQE
jgi:hypothetical protein